MKCVDCVFMAECEKFKTEFDRQQESCPHFVLRCDVSSECTQKRCRHNSTRPIFSIANLLSQPVCGADPQVMLSDYLAVRAKKLKGAVKKGLRCGARVSDFNATVSHWFWDSENNLICNLLFDCGSGSLTINQVHFTGKNGYERMDGWQYSPQIPAWLSPTGGLAKEPLPRSGSRREQIWFATVNYEFPWYDVSVTCESEWVTTRCAVWDNVESWLQKIFDDYDLDPQRTFAFGFSFVPDWFRCKVRRIYGE